jgi:flagellar motility protein MotE (MotC chaperone)
VLEVTIELPNDLGILDSRVLALEANDSAQQALERLDELAPLQQKFEALQTEVHSTVDTLEESVNDLQDQVCS